MKKTKKSSIKSVKRIRPKKSKELPATQGQFEEFRAEMNSKFTSVHLEFKGVRHDMVAMEKRLDARFSQIDARFSQVDARFSQIEAKISQLEAKIEALIAVVHQMRMVVEEQNARNKFVLDGYANLDSRFEFNRIQTDARIGQIEQVIKKAKPEEPAP